MGNNNNNNNSVAAWSVTWRKLAQKIAQTHILTACGSVCECQCECVFVCGLYLMRRSINFFIFPDANLSTHPLDSLQIVSLALQVKQLDESSRVIILSRKQNVAACQYLRRILCGGPFVACSILWPTQSLHLPWRTLLLIYLYLLSCLFIVLPLIGFYCEFGLGFGHGFRYWFWALALHT